MATADELTFEPPGYGTWHRVGGHFTEPLTRYFRDIYPERMPAATNRGRAEYGVLSELDSGMVNGYWYMRSRPIVPDPPHAEHRPESRAELEAEFERRVDRMAETFETKRWRSDLERWDSEWKPEHRDTLLSLQRVEAAGLDDDDELLAHVADCRDASLRGTELHHRMSSCWLPVPDFLAHATEWTDRSRDDLIRLLDGASPVSTGAVDELADAAAAVDGDDEARRLLFSDAPPAVILDRLRGHTDAVGTAVDRWLDHAAYRLATGDDLSAVTAREQPDLLVGTLRSATEDGRRDPADHDHEERLAAVREEVPRDHRETFDELFAEARDVHRIKDDREIDLWSLGVLRWALLEAGRRLADRGRLYDREHVVDLSHDELVTLVRDGAGPSADAVADRVTYRRTHGPGDAPDRLGPEPTDPFEDVDLPEATARAHRAYETLGAPDVPDPDDDSEAVVRGHAASPGTYEGPARVLDGPDDLGRIDDGDVLVTDLTSTAFNVALPLLGAIVTDMGGMLSHPAIVAREFGIPAVTGCEDATDRLADGDRVVVDGDEGTVRRR